MVEHAADLSQLLSIGLMAWRQDGQRSSDNPNSLRGASSGVDMEA